MLLPIAPEAGAMNVGGLGAAEVAATAGEGAAVGSAEGLIAATAQEQANLGVEGLTGLMSSAEREAFNANPAGGTRFLVQVVHRETATSLDLKYPGRFTYSTKGPDFYDTWTHQKIELTTRGQVASHETRAGYEGAIYAAYTLPK